MLIATKLKLATGSYILQQKRAKLIHNENPTCKLCDAEDEDVEHFVLRCVCLQPIRSSYINDLFVIFHEATAKEFLELPSINQIQIIMDCISELKFHKDNVGPKKSDMDLLEESTNSLEDCASIYTRAYQVIEHKEEVNDILLQCI
jgi:hypothetical protein